MKNFQFRNILILVLIITYKVSTKCRIKSLSKRTKIPGDTIISGTVKSFYMKGSGGPFAGKVQVRRVFRGKKGLEGKMVIVEGFGSSVFCLSSPRLGDTKIFFLQSRSLRHNRLPTKNLFKLAHNILKLSLKNLKVLWKLEKRGVKGKNIKMFNDQNDSTGIVSVTRQAKTRKQEPVKARLSSCNISCPFHGVGPICGTDGQNMNIQIIVIAPTQQ